MVAAVLECDEDLPEWLQSQPPAVPGPLRHHLIRTDLADQLERRKTNEYRYMPAYQLKAEHEYWGWMLIEYEMRQGASPDIDLSYGVHVAKSNLELVERAMKRLANLKEDSGRSPRLAPDNYGGIDFSAVKDRLRIEEVVDRMSMHYKLERRGSRLWTHCFLPGHMADNTASLMVEPEKQHCWCFGCNRGGDVIELASHWFNQPNGAAAVDHLCRYMGIDVPRLPGRQPVRKTTETASAMACVGPGDRVVSFNPSRLARGRRRGR